MAREFLWVTRRGNGTAIDEGTRVSIELTSTITPTDATVTRVLVWAVIGGVLDISLQSAAGAIVGVSAGGTPPADPFSTANLQATDWLGIAEQGLDAPNATTTTVKRTLADSFAPVFDVRAQRRLEVGEDVWLSMGVEGQIVSGTWNHFWLARVLLLLPAA